MELLLNPHGSDETNDDDSITISTKLFLTHTVQMKLEKIPGKGGKNVIFLTHTVQMKVSP